MKKILTLTVLLATSLVSQAQVQRHLVQSFINAYSVTVSNTFAITNLTSNSSTNTWGTTFTNYSGVAELVTNNAAITNTALTFENYNLLGAAYLWESTYHGPSLITTTTNFITAGQSVMIRLVGGSGANAAVNFVFVPVPDGSNESTISGDSWTVGVTATTTTPTCMFTNVPARFIGCAKLRLKTITNTDTDASSKVDVLNCALVGFPAVNQ